MAGIERALSNYRSGLQVDTGWDNRAVSRNCGQFHVPELTAKLWVALDCCSWRKWWFLCWDYVGSSSGSRPYSPCTFCIVHKYHRTHLTGKPPRQDPKFRPWSLWNAQNVNTTSRRCSVSLERGEIAIHTGRWRRKPNKRLRDCPASAGWGSWKRRYWADRIYSPRHGNHVRRLHSRRFWYAALRNACGGADIYRQISCPCKWHWQLWRAGRSVTWSPCACSPDSSSPLRTRASKAADQFEWRGSMYFLSCDSRFSANV